MSDSAFSAAADAPKMMDAKKRGSDHNHNGDDDDAPVGGSRKPAGESQQVEDGCQQATASRRDRTDKLTRESRKPAGASQQVDGGCQQATASQQARERTDKLDRCGSQQATASRREKEASRWKPAGGRWKPAGDSQQQHHQQQP